MNSELRRLIRVGAFAVLAAGAFLAAYALRFGGPVPLHLWTHMVAACGCAVGVKTFAFCWHRLDQGVNRYIGFHDLLLLARATFWGTVGLTFIDSFLLPYDSIPRGVVLIDGVTTLVAIGLLRSAPRAWRDLKAQLLPGKDKKRVLIVGANDDGETLLRSLQGGRSGRYRVVGFIDADRGRQGDRIGGVPVLGQLESLANVIATMSVAEVLVTGDLPGRTVRAIHADAHSMDTPVRVLPSYEQLLGGKVSVQPRDVAIEDLLRREPAPLESQRIGEWLAGKTVLVTGSAGSIGSEVCKQLLRHGAERLVALDRTETGQFFLERELLRHAGESSSVEVVLADATDSARIDAVFSEYRPDLVFHAAAYKHVPLMEKHPGEAVKNIALATRNIADAAEIHGAEAFVMISTDKAVNPTSVMGSCKRLAERYVQAKSVGSACRFNTVRFGNVLDSAGSVVPIFRQQIALGGPVTVTHEDINRYFMMIPEAAGLVLQAGVMGRGGEIFVLDMGDPVRIVDLARDMIRLSGLREGEDIELKITGLRPGEKLYEELYDESERHTRTSHSKVLVADSQPEAVLRVIHQLNQLAEIADAQPEAIRDRLAEFVPRLESPATTRRAA
ncbi:MAG: nucleoside-diphosphate sugar epimerase/dehydratase [Planctomycetota bacterium]